MDQTTVAMFLKVLAGLGVTSVAGFISLYVAWISFAPELVVEAVVDKSRRFNSESRIRIKNIGRLPAVGIQTDAENVCASVGGMRMVDCGFYGGPRGIPRLSGGETVEVSVSPGIQFGEAQQITEFSYRLTLKYRTKLFGFSRSFGKSWSVALRNFEDGF